MKRTIFVMRLTDCLLRPSWGGRNRMTRFAKGGTMKKRLAALAAIAAVVAFALPVAGNASGGVVCGPACSPPPPPPSPHCVPGLCFP